MLQIIEIMLLSVGLLVIASFIMGVVFDRVRNERWRQLLVGLTGGVFAATVITLAVNVSGLITDGRNVLLFVTGLFAGPWGALLALPLPMAVRADIGGPAASVGLGAMVSSYAIGAAVHVVHKLMRRRIDRLSVLCLAALSPLILLWFFVPMDYVPRDQLAHVFWTLAIYLPLGTLIFGWLVTNEQTRSKMRRDERVQRSFLDEADFVDRNMFRRQLDHSYSMCARYGSHYAFLMIAIDQAGETEKILGEQGWQKTRRELARTVRSSVRDCDVASALADDRFAVLLPFVTSATARSVAERIQVAVAAAMAHVGTRVTVSIGIADSAAASGPDDVEVAAEGALYLANARQPRGVIAPLVEAVEAAPSPVRSFPGAVDASRTSPSAAEIIPLKPEARLHPDVTVFGLNTQPPSETAADAVYLDRVREAGRSKSTAA